MQEPEDHRIDERVDFVQTGAETGSEWGASVQRSDRPDDQRREFLVAGKNRPARRAVRRLRQEPPRESSAVDERVDPVEPGAKIGRRSGSGSHSCDPRTEVRQDSAAAAAVRPARSAVRLPRDPSFDPGERED